MNKRTLGTEYEQKAAEYLSNKGFEVLQRNYRCKAGELDIVAKDDETLVVVEVKYRSSDHFGYPEEAVNARKIHHIRTATKWFLSENPKFSNNNIRFDVISILNNKITHIKDAF